MATSSVTVFVACHNFGDIDWRQVYDTTHTGEVVHGRFDDEMGETNLQDMPVKALSWCVMWSMGLIQNYQLVDW